MQDDFREEFWAWANGSTRDTPPSERAVEKFDALHVADYCHWRRLGLEQGEALWNARKSAEKRAEATAEADERKQRAKAAGSATVAPLPEWVRKQIATGDGPYAELFRSKGEKYAGAYVRRYEFLQIDAIIDAIARTVRKRFAALEAALANYEYRGIWKPSTPYKKGNSATFDGSTWICTEDDTTTKPGTGTGWKLSVKRGKDADPAEIAKRLLPEVKRAIAQSQEKQ
jgi:hypothetical protein